MITRIIFVLLFPLFTYAQKRNSPLFCLNGLNKFKCIETSDSTNFMIVTEDKCLIIINSFNLSSEYGIRIKFIFNDTHFIGIMKDKKNEFFFKKKAKFFFEKSLYGFYYKKSVLENIKNIKFDKDSYKFLTTYDTLYKDSIDILCQEISFNTFMIEVSMSHHL